MLQQTRVETVLPYYARFMARFPTVDDLAAAELDEVLGMWSGLGYYSRARNMHRAAKEVVRLGKFPSTLTDIRALPGVGEYMAGAIGSIAFGLDVAAVDGNLHRVLSRLHAHSGARKDMWALANQHLPKGRAGDFNQALMDLGSRICTARSPRCGACPVSSHCKAHASQTVNQFPVKSKKKKVPNRQAVCGVLWRSGKLLLVRRPDKGLYGGLYELPGDFVLEGEHPTAALKRIATEKLGMNVDVGAEIGAVSHTLTHMKLTLHICVMTSSSAVLLNGYTALHWWNDSAASSLDAGMSTLSSKALALVMDHQKQPSLLGLMN